MEKFLVKNALEAQNLVLILNQYKDDEIWKNGNHTKQEIILQHAKMKSRHQTLIQVIAEYKGYTLETAILFVKNYGVFND